MLDSDIRRYLAEALELSGKGVSEGLGGPFGCIIVRDGVVVGSGCNRVIADNDPTAHAEVVAIRQACTRIGSFQLEGCWIFCSSEPCPMCLGAIYWARPERVYFVNARDVAAGAGFDDEFIYREIQVPMEERSIPFEQVCLPGGEKVLKEWARKPDKRIY